MAFLLAPFSLAKKRIYLLTQLKAELTDLLWKLLMFPILTSRNRMMNTFITLPPYVRDSSEDKSMLFHFKKTFVLSSVWSGREHTWAIIWKKSLLICFKSYQDILYSHKGRVDRNLNILLMVNINPICTRDSLEDK